MPPVRTGKQDAMKHALSGAAQAIDEEAVHFGDDLFIAKATVLALESIH